MSVLPKGGIKFRSQPDIDKGSKSFSARGSGILDFDLGSHEFQTSACNRSSLFKHTKPLSYEHPGKAMTRVPNLEMRRFLAYFEDTCLR